MAAQLLPRVQPGSCPAQLYTMLNEELDERHGCRPAHCWGYQEWTVGTRLLELTTKYPLLLFACWTFWEASNSCTEKEQGWVFILPAHCLVHNKIQKLSMFIHFTQKQTLQICCSGCKTSRESSIQRGIMKLEQWRFGTPELWPRNHNILCQTTSSDWVHSSCFSQDWGSYRRGVRL